MIGNIIVAVLALLGSTLAVTTAIGMVRFPDTLSRMHGATKPQTFGLLMMLIAAAISLGNNVDVGMIGLACAFALVTAPVVAHRIGRLVYQEQRAGNGLGSPEDLPPADRD